MVKCLFITGRSLGGALSTICAYDIHNIDDVEIVHYSFSSPRVGNAIFAKEFNRRVVHSYWTYNTEDLVTEIPSSVMRKTLFNT